MRTGGEGWGGSKWEGGEREGGEGGEGEGRDGEEGEIGPPRIFDKFTPMTAVVGNMMSVLSVDGEPCTMALT